MTKIYPAVVLLFLTIRTFAQQQITDFHTNPGDNVSYPRSFREINGSLLFVANTVETGDEIWMINDYYGSQPVPLFDINPGEAGSHADILHGAFLKETLFFTADDGMDGLQIWATRGAADGARRITDYLDGEPTGLTTVGDSYFFITLSGNRFSVWSAKENMYPKLIKGDIPKWNAPIFTVACNNLFFFGIQLEGTNNYKIWRSDGSTEGTYPITDELPVNAFDLHVVYQNALYVTGKGGMLPANSVGLLRLNGDDNQTELVKVFDGLDDVTFELGDAVVFDDQIYFSLFDFQDKRQIIWRSDGTADGTVNVWDKTASHYFTPSKFYKDNATLFFTTASSNQGTSLSGIASGASVVETFVEIRQDDPIIPFFIPTLSAGQIWKSASKYIVALPDDFYSTVAYQSDLTPSQTKRLEPLDDVFETCLYKGLLYYAQAPLNTNGELYALNESVTSELVKNISTSKFGMNNKSLEILNENAFFDANDGTGPALWMYQDNSDPVKIDNNPNALTHIDDELYYSSDGMSVSSELRRTTGLKSEQILPIDADQAASYFDNFTLFKGTVYFSATSTKTNKLFLGKIEGNTYTLIEDLEDSGYDYVFPRAKIKATNEELYILTTYSNKLWVGDGTTSGTFKLKDLAFSEYNEILAVADKLFLINVDENQGLTELWVTQGKEENTKLLKEFSLNRKGSGHSLTALGNILIYTASTPEFGEELWRSDGTEAGTYLLKDIWEGPASGAVESEFTPFQNRLVFNITKERSDASISLWITDGTSDGTKEINPNGFVGSAPKYITAVDDQLYFQAYEGINGTEIWRWDEYAKIFADIAPGTTSSNPHNFKSYGNDLLFVASANGQGDQLWRMNITPVEPVTAIEGPVTSLVSVFPNPVDDRVIFSSNENAIIQKVTLYNIQGEKIIASGLSEENDMNVGNLSAGVYILHIETTKGQYQTKLIKK